jgi:hypothetical protein
MHRGLASLLLLFSLPTLDRVRAALRRTTRYEVLVRTARRTAQRAAHRDSGRRSGEDQRVWRYAGVHGTPLRPRRKQIDQSVKAAQSLDATCGQQRIASEDKRIQRGTCKAGRALSRTGFAAVPGAVSPGLAPSSPIRLRLAVRERGQPLGRALRVHRLPDGEIPVELDVCVGSREGLWPCCCIDNPAVDHFDQALAAPEIFGKGGGRSRCIGSNSHFAADRSARRCL